MFDLFKKTMYTGVGLALLAKEEVDEVAREWVRKSELSEKEGKEFVEKLRKRYEDQQEELEARVEAKVKEIMETMDIASREEFLALKNEVVLLKTELAALKAGLETSPTP